MSAGNTTAEKIALVYNWNDLPVSSCKIFFSHPVKIHSVFRNDSTNTDLEYSITHEDKIVTIQLAEPVPKYSKFTDGIKIKFTTTNKYVKMDKFVWFANKDGSGTEKPAPPDELKKLNDYFHLAPPLPPRITQPKDKESSYRDTPDIKGTARAKSTVAVLIDGKKQKPLSTSNESSTWLFRVSIPLTTGEHRFTAKLVDSDGSESEESAPIRYTVKPPPQKPTK